MRRALVAAGAVAVALAAATATASAASTLCVGGGGCYATIQAAVNAATDGDTIKLNPGTFAGGVQVGKSVAIVGAGASRSIIEGGGPVLTLGNNGAPTQPTISIRGVTITGGMNTGAAPDFAGALGGGIFISDSETPDGPKPGATVTIADSVITGNTAQPSGTTDFGIQCPPGVDCPGALASGAGIYSAGNLTVVNSVISNNHALTPTAFAFGGGIRETLGSLTVKHSIVAGNEATATAPHGLAAKGAGIMASAATSVLISGSVVANNRSSVSGTYPAGVGMTAQTGGIEISDNIFSPNTTTTITDTKIVGNSAVANDVNGDPAAFDAGLYVTEGASLAISSSVVGGNRTAVTAAAPLSDFPSGAAFEVDEAATISHVQVVGNSTSVTGVTGPAAGFGAFLAFSDQPVIVTDSLIAGNSVQVSATGGAASVEGAGVTNFGTLTFRNTSVAFNTGRASGPSGSVQGGGIWNGSLLGSTPQLTLVGTSVTRNAISGSAGLTLQGGGLFTAFPVTLTNSAIKSNTPDQCIGC
jgi:fibronectin-binding autotransporter adhesin